MTRNAENPPADRPPSDSGRLGAWIAGGVVLLFVLFMVNSAPRAESVEARGDTGCQAFYQRFGRLLSSMPRDAGKKARMRAW